MVISTILTWFVSLFISDAMAETLTNSFQNFYNKYTQLMDNSASPTDHRRKPDIYIVPVNTVADDDKQQHHRLLQQQRYRAKSRRIFTFDPRQLCQAKQSKWQVMRQKKMRPVVGQRCSVCIPYTAHGNTKVESNLKNLLDIYNISTVQKSVFGFFVDSLMFFYRQKNQQYEYIYDQVLEDEIVVKAINEAALETCSNDAITEDREKCFLDEIKKQRENTERTLTVISANVKNWVYKVIGWFTFRMISLLSTSLVVQPSQIDTVREAEQSGLPIIYLPLHKSHMDYTLLGLVLTMHNIKPPIVAAGQNLRVFFISKLLSYLGAFYIKRQIDTKKDKLYWAILSSYIKNCLKSGHHIEFFLEGARTRSGKCCVPKGGLLSIIVDAYRNGIIEDAWIIPVSMNYDKILEGNFVREQLGQPKKKETFFMAMWTFIKVICSHYGVMRVDFNVPYRLRDLYESIEIKTKLQNEVLRKDGLEMSENILYKHTIDGMAKHIVYDCWKSTAIMSTNAVCFLFLKKYRNGATSIQLAVDLSIMRDKLSQANRDLGFSGNSNDVVKHALSLLVPKLIMCEKTDAGHIFKPILSVPSLIELSYYANSLLSHYLHQSVVAIALSKLVGQEFWNQTVTETKISRNELMECVIFLTNLLQFDFVFIKPCDNLDNIVDRVIRCFEEEDIILIDMLLDEEKHSRNLAAFLDYDSDSDYQESYRACDVKYRVNANEKSLKNIKFYCSIVMPFLECVAECAGSFLAMPHVYLVPEREHVQTVLKQMHENLEEGILFYGESISVDTIKHSFLAFEKFNCLNITMKDNERTLTNVDNTTNDLDPMQVLSDFIEEFVIQIDSVFA